MKQKTWLSRFLQPPKPTNTFCRDGLEGEILRADKSWQPILEVWRNSGGLARVNDFLSHQTIANGRIVLPAHPLRFLQTTPRSDVKVVIIGDQPTRIGNVADGLAFSSALPRNYSIHSRAIASEIERDLCIGQPGLASLDHWASQGILLMNLVPTVDYSNTDSHRAVGWEELTTAIALDLAGDPAPRVFMLWGKRVRIALSELLKQTNSNILLLEAGMPHPEEPSRRDSFKGCGHFSKANEYLRLHGRRVEWTRDDLSILFPEIDIG